MRTEDESDGSELARRPRHAGSVTADVEVTARTSLQASAVFVGDRFNQNGERGRLDGYTVVGLAASYEVVHGVDIHGRIDNLFEADHKEVENRSEEHTSELQPL